MSTPTTGHSTVPSTGSSTAKTGHSQRLDFEGSSGELLSGRLDLPQGPPDAYALFAHCFTCSKDVHAAARIAAALVRQDIAVLRFDFTGLGASGGDFTATTFSSNVEDVVLAAQHLAAGHAAPALLIGHSLGGAAVLAAAARLPATRAVATIGAPAGPDHVLDLIGEHRRHEIERDGVAEVTLGRRSFQIRRAFLDDITGQPQADRIAHLDAALLVMHSPVDEVVGIDDARAIFDTARHPKSFVALDGADHLLSAPADARFAATVLSSWARRYVAADAPRAELATFSYLRSAETQPEDTEEPTVTGEVVVRSDGTRFGQHIQAGSHSFRADEPAPVGADTGPSPYDLLLAGLGACTSMTLRMYAARKGWPLDEVRVWLAHAREHAEDCQGSDRTTPLLDSVEVVIELDGNLSPAQRRRLLEMAYRCPVHRTLTSQVRVRASLAESSGSG